MALLPASAYKARWFDCETGKYAEVKKVSKSGDKWQVNLAIPAESGVVLIAGSN